MPVYTSSEVVSVTGTSAAFATALDPRIQYALVATTNIWWRIGADAEVATAGSHLLVAGDARVIRSPHGGTVRCIKADGAADGSAVLSTLDAP